MSSQLLIDTCNARFQLASCLLRAEQEGASNRHVRATQELVQVALNGWHDLRQEYAQLAQDLASNQLVDSLLPIGEKVLSLFDSLLVLLDRCRSAVRDVSREGCAVPQAEQLDSVFAEAERTREEFINCWPWDQLLPSEPVGDETELARVVAEFQLPAARLRTIREKHGPPLEWYGQEGKPF